MLISVLWHLDRIVGWHDLLFSWSFTDDVANLINLVIVKLFDCLVYLHLFLVLSFLSDLLSFG